PSIAYAYVQGASFVGALRSADAGQSWTAVALPGIVASSGNDADLAQSNDGAAIALAAGHGVYRSDDHGLSWYALGLPGGPSDSIHRIRRIAPCRVPNEPLRGERLGIHRRRRHLD